MVRDPQHHNERKLTRHNKVGIMFINYILLAAFLVLIYLPYTVYEYKRILTLVVSILTL